ncbi:MAG: SprB repeat-containing protein [Sphingobacteriales bacterium]|nr:SprB repeat-containing protein [Sphingobacteriales bacterium]
MPYTYLWSNGSTTEDIGGLTAGNYGVTVTDANGCNITDTYLITEPSAVAITVDSSTPTTCNGAPTGSIAISVSGGTPGYTYLWSNGSTTEDVSGLSAGNYVVTVTDANGCTSTVEQRYLAQVRWLLRQRLLRCCVMAAIMAR